MLKLTPKPLGSKMALWLAFSALLACSLVLAKANLDRMHSLALSRYGQETAATVAQWQLLIANIEALSDREKLTQVNDFFNTRIRFVQDIDTWNQLDYWATPLETMGRGQGDCEDFSIAKFATLLLAGVDMDRLRITYVKARTGGPNGDIQVAHMILAYYPTPSAEPLILDNLIMRILPASQRDDLTPVFGFNSKGLWVGGSTAPASKNPGAKLSRWRDLIQRMEQDGLG